MIYVRQLYTHNLRIVKLVLQRRSLLNGNGVRFARKFFADNLQVTVCENQIPDVRTVAQKCETLKFSD